MKIYNFIAIFLFVALCSSFAQESKKLYPTFPTEQDLSVYKQRMDTFDYFSIYEYLAYYPDDKNLLLYRLLFFAHFDCPLIFVQMLSSFTLQKSNEKDIFSRNIRMKYESKDTIYQNLRFRYFTSGRERLPSSPLFRSESYSNGVKTIPPLPTTTKSDSMKIKIIDNIDIKTYNDYVAKYPEDKDRLILTLYMMYATRCELSYKVMCDYISAKYGYRNPELVSRVISELTMQRERLGSYYLELLQDEYLCEDTAKHAQVNKYIFQRMAFEFTDDFFREYMFQTDEVKQQFIWEVSHPMAEGYDIQACLNNIENSTVLSENEKHRLMKALNK